MKRSYIQGGAGGGRGEREKKTDIAIVKTFGCATFGSGVIWRYFFMGSMHACLPEKKGKKRAYTHTHTHVELYIYL